MVTLGMCHVNDELLPLSKDYADFELQIILNIKLDLPPFSRHR